MSLFESILEARGLKGHLRETFLHPQYEAGHDPYLLPDMAAGVERLVKAREQQEHITIYGDYDIDGLTATTVLVEAFSAFGFRFVETFIPNRFVEGYGMTVDAVERIAAEGATLIVTVDCGSLSEEPIARAKELGVDVIVTDHHNVAPVQPPAVAVINPKRLLQDYPKKYRNLQLISKIQDPRSKNRSLYPFLDLPGVGVAFKLVQALQTRLDGLPIGQEKWLLDLVALGTVCDVVTLVDENRTHVYWGLKVLAKTKRPGLKALMAVSGIDPEKVNARSLGFALGPRMNAAGRLETAKFVQDMLLTKKGEIALDLAQQLDAMNAKRRAAQDDILKGAMAQAEERRYDEVVVVSHPDWNHGIVGIVAATLLERYKKPTFVLQEMGEESKGSARSYGDFSAADAIRASDDLITKGGGHKLAAGVTLPTANIDLFRQRVNEYYASLQLSPQTALLLPTSDVVVNDLSEVDEKFVNQLQAMEPFGNGNAEPILCLVGASIRGVRRMGADAQHLKIEVADKVGRRIQLIAFNADESWEPEVGDSMSVWFHPIINEWQGRRSVEGRLVRLESA
ncbi:MAG: DHH family phosphoesterase [Candidatus Saccharibacteria bacterium]|nr:DHH family phosphoesterase [Candidatus Saccharibacteria bacterium]